MEDNSINRNRLVADDLIFHAYSCQICENLLWKPRSCSSCQKILCEKCIQIWLQNPINLNKCPFCCEPAVYRPCSDLLKPLLSCLEIRCRNETLGCTEILSYDQLEHHEAVECQYLSQRCVECDQLVLLSKIVEHKQTAGQCVSCPIKCIICQNSFEKIDFQEHQPECRQRRIDQLNAITSSDRNMGNDFPDNERMVPNSELMYFVKLNSNIDSIEDQRLVSPIPKFWRPINAFQQAGEQNCDYFLYLSMMLNFCFLNWSRIPYVIFLIVFCGIEIILGITLDIYISFSQLIKRYGLLGSIGVMLLIYILTSANFIFVRSFSDQTIIFCFITFSFLLGCSLKIPLKVFKIEPVLRNQLRSMIHGCLRLFIMKLILLLIRLYYSFIPTDLAISLIVFFTYQLICAVSGLRDMNDLTDNS